MKRKTILGLEFLRGICAILVALGHMLHWSHTAEFQNWTIHGVACFFVISGAVIYYNYKDMPALDVFIFKRFARLAPLYCFAMLATYVGLRYGLQWNILIQASMLFGLMGGRCMVLGCWSLGVEFVLYLLFPFLLAFTRSIGGVLAMFCFLLVLRIAGMEDATPANYWGFYTNPGTFIVLFFGGMMVAKYAPRLIFSGAFYVIGSILFALALFGYQTMRSQVFGIEGIAMIAACIALVACFWHLELPFSRFLGEISYGVYLLHPITWGALHTLFKLPVWLCVTATLPLTAIAAWMILQLYEKPVKRWMVGRYMRSSNELPSAAPSALPAE